MMNGLLCILAVGAATARLTPLTGEQRTPIEIRFAGEGIGIDADAIPRIVKAGNDCLRGERRWHGLLSCRTRTALGE